MPAPAGSPHFIDTNDDGWTVGGLVEDRGRRKGATKWGTSYRHITWNDQNRMNSPMKVAAWLQRCLNKCQFLASVQQMIPYLASQVFAIE